MIAGGTGLTPCYQVLSAILRDPKDTTKVRFLYANRTPDDILARDILEGLAAKHPDRFTLSLTVDQVNSENNSNLSPTAWKGYVGFVDSEMTKATLFPASDSGICLMCGPPIMLEKACHPALHAMGYAKEDIFCFWSPSRLAEPVTYFRPRPAKSGCLVCQPLSALTYIDVDVARRKRLFQEP